MATAGTSRHPGGRPTVIVTLTPFGRALAPVLARLDWSINDLARKTGQEPTTIWRWMKRAKKWPPTDETDAISKVVGVRLTAPPARRKSR